MQTLGTPSRPRALIASGLAVALLGGGVAVSQFMAADAVAPVAPAATASASTTPVASATPVASTTPTPTASATPEDVDYCSRTDAQIQADHPTAVPKDVNGTRNWYKDGVIIGMTQDGVGWEAPCWVR